MKTDIFTLDNGLKIVLVDTKAFPSLTTILLVGAGSRYEKQDNNGVAHFFEHMAFKGSKKYPNSFLINSTIDSLGGYNNAFTSKDHTGYWIKSTNEHFETAIDVISDMVLNPLIQEEEIEREKGVITEELNMYEDTPMYKVGDYFDQLLYKDNSLGLDIIGTKKTIKEMDRKKFTNYIESLYKPNNSVLAIAGGLYSSNLKIEDYKKIIEEKFSNWQKEDYLKIEKVKENQLKQEMLLKERKTEQAHFILGFRTFSRSDEKKYALIVSQALLGGSMSSRLFTQVRERLGLCYYIRTQSDLFEDVGNIATSAGIALDKDKIKQAITVILNEHKKIKTGELTEEEVTKAKELVKGRFILSLEDSVSIATINGKRILFDNEPVNVKNYIAKIDAVKKEDIINLASEIFVNEKLNFTMISTFGKKTDFEDVLYI